MTLMSSESPYSSEFLNKEKGRHTQSLLFLPRSQHKIEMWRNSHRKRLFCSSGSIMTAWALERSVSCWATPFPVLFSPAWQLICWLPIRFCLPSDFFHSLFCSFAILSALISGSWWCAYFWQVIVINHVHASDLLCSKTSLRKTYSGIAFFLEIFTVWTSVDSQ